MTGRSAEEGQSHRGKRALCIADLETMSVVNETVKLFGWRLDTVETEQQATHHLQHDSYEAIIAAVITRTGQFNLFDSTAVVDGNSNRVVYQSTLLQQAMLTSPSTFRIIYGLEAVEIPDIRHACFNCGADAVVNSSGALFTALFGFVTPPPPPPPPPLVEEAGTVNALLDTQINSSSTRGRQLLEIADGTMTRRVEKVSQGKRQLQGMTQVMRPRQLQGITQVMCPRDTMSGDHFLQTNPTTTTTTTTDTSTNPTTLKPMSAPAYKRDLNDMPSIRIVHVSDTKNMHRNLVLPEGDLFLHTGNFTDGKKTTCLDQFHDFLLWIDEVVLTKFRQVVFVAGHQDFFLDIIACQYSAISRYAQRVLNDFLSRHRTVAFLENTSITFHGLRIHGNSTVWKKDCAKTKTTTTKYGGFERPYVPNLATNHVECDILLTHRPPSCLFADCYYQLPSDDMYGVTDEKEATAAAAARVEQNKSKLKRGLFRKSKASSVKEKSVKKVTVNPPRLHAFGHYGKDVGIDQYGGAAGTLMLNGSQERVLKKDKHGGGNPIVVNLPLPNPRIDVTFHGNMLHTVSANLG